MNESDPRQTHAAFPLSALFLLTAAAGVMASILSPVLRGLMSGNVEAGYVLLAAAISSGILTLLGAMFGATQEDRITSVTHGMIVGWLLGALLGPLLLVPASSFQASLIGAIGGAVVLVGIAGLIHLASRR